MYEYELSATLLQILSFDCIHSSLRRLHKITRIGNRDSLLAERFEGGELECSRTTAVLGVSGLLRHNTTNVMIEKQKHSKFLTMITSMMIRQHFAEQSSDSNVERKEHRRTAIREKN